MKIAIVEDDRPQLRNLELLLYWEADMEVLGTFSSGEDALTALKSYHLDVLLTDLDLSDMTGVELIGKVKEKFPDIDVMAHTVIDDRDSVMSAIRAGAAGYMLKDSRPSELIEAIYDLHNGGAPMSPRIARMLIQEVQDRGEGEQSLLSPREKEVIKKIERGLSYQEIADEMNISPQTVHVHVKNIYKKLRAADRRDALLKARKQGII
jgi:DNA-binding NarL/FixJ family response regulator